MHTFGDLREAALRVERLMEEEKRVTAREHESTKSTGKRIGNFSMTAGASRGRGSGFRGGSSNRGEVFRQTPAGQKPRCDVCGKKHEGECWHLDRE